MVPTLGPKVPSGEAGRFVLVQDLGLRPQQGTARGEGPSDRVFRPCSSSRPVGRMGANLTSRQEGVLIRAAFGGEGVRHRRATKSEGGQTADQPHHRGEPTGLIRPAG